MVQAMLSCLMFYSCCNSFVAAGDHLYMCGQLLRQLCVSKLKDGNQLGCFVPELHMRGAWQYFLLQSLITDNLLVNM